MEFNIYYHILNEVSNSEDSLLFSRLAINNFAFLIFKNKSKYIIF
jgi:hypothetical protein